jgi:hypothetical protein
MEIVKETEEYQIVKKRSGRYGIRKRDRSWVTGDEKVKILVSEGLIKLTEPTKEPEPEETPAEGEEAAEAAEAAEESGEETESAAENAD